MTTSDLARHVRDQLDEQYPPGKLVPIEDLAAVCDLLYEYATALWASAVLGALEDYAQRNDISFRAAAGVRLPHSFLLGSTVFTLRVGASMTDPRTICLNLVRASSVDVARLIDRGAALDVSGRYRQIRLYLDEALAPATDLVKEISHAVLTASDRWIEAFAVAQLASIQDDPVAQLYALARRPFSAEIGRSIRIYLVDPAAGGGVFLDEEARRDTLDRLAGYAYTSYERAPVELLTGLVVARFRPDQTVAHDIVPSMTTVVKSALEIPSATEVGLAQHVMYHGSGMVLQPLVATDRLWVEAAYPVVLRSEIEPVLEAERQTMEDAVKRLKFGNVASRSELSRGRRMERARRAGLGDQLAGLAGRFTGGFMSEYIGH